MNTFLIRRRGGLKQWSGYGGAL